MLQDISKKPKLQKLTTIAELRRAHNASKQDKRKQSRPTPKPQDMPRMIIRLPNADVDYMAHCDILMELSNKLACVHNTVSLLTPSAIYRLFSSYNWTCPHTGIAHRDNTPLTFNFTYPLHLGGNVAISNITPRYRPFLSAGQWAITHPANIEYPDFSYTGGA
ncbi:MAG: hypothetical protein Pars93KO_26620 [Parasphingorhabdus sp.]